MVSKEALFARIDELLPKAGNALHPSDVSEAYHGTLTLLRLVYGPGGIQESQLIQTMTAADKSKGARGFVLRSMISPAVHGALAALKSDVQGDLVGSVGLQANGEVSGDFLALAKECLADAANDARKNVAAVLVAASFEDALRRLAAERAGITKRIDLEELIGVLKKAGVLAGAAVSTAKGFQRFRNDSLHADFGKVDQTTIGSCLAFVEGLLHQHFS